MNRSVHHSPTSRRKRRKKGQYLKKNKHMQPFIFFYLVEERSCVGMDGPENHISDNRTHCQPHQAHSNRAQSINEHLIHSKDRHCRVKILMGEIIPTSQEPQKCGRDRENTFVESSGSTECEIGVPVHALALDKVVGAIEV